MADRKRTRESSPAHHQRTRPCDACRRRKSKCVVNPGSTVCVLCGLHALECVFSKPPIAKKKSVSGAGGGGGSSDPGRSPAKRLRLLPGRGIEYDVRPGSSLLKRTLGLQNLHHTRYLAPHGILDVYDCLTGLEQPSQNSTENHTDPPTVQVRMVHPQHAFQIIADADTPKYDEEDNFLDLIDQVVSNCAVQLVSLYFRVVHPAFPVLQKDVFLEKHARSRHEFSPPCLAAVYLLAIDFWSYSDDLTAVPKPDVGELKRLAYESLDLAVTRPKLSVIQAGLLLSQYFAADDKSAFASRISRLTTQLTDVAYSLGLHIDPGEWDIPLWEIGLRRRLSWAVFMQDKWTSLLHGCAPRILASHWERYALQPQDFPEHIEDETVGSSEVERGRLIFTELASLACILSDILDSFLSVHFQRQINSSHDGFAVALSHIEPLQNRLQAWSANLPIPLQSANNTPTTMKLSSIGQLRLAHLAVEACLHRFMLRTISISVLPDPAATYTIRQHAMEKFSYAVHFLSNLQAPQLASFWYSISARSCVLVYQLGAALQRTAPNLEENEAISREVKAYKWALKMNGRAGAEFMNQALEMLGATHTFVTAPGGGGGGGAAGMGEWSAAASLTPMSNGQQHHDVWPGVEWGLYGQEAVYTHVPHDM